MHKINKILLCFILQSTLFLLSKENNSVLQIGKWYYLYDFKLSNIMHDVLKINTEYFAIIYNSKVLPTHIHNFFSNIIWITNFLKQKMLSLVSSDTYIAKLCGNVNNSNINQNLKEIGIDFLFCFSLYHLHFLQKIMFWTKRSKLTSFIYQVLISCYLLFYSLLQNQFIPFESMLIMFVLIKLNNVFFAKKKQIQWINNHINKCYYFSISKYIHIM